MPRPIVAADKRRRVAQACDNCKRRKERCNGIRPCSICIRRRREPECHFSDTPARLLRPKGHGGVGGENDVSSIGDDDDVHQHQLRLVQQQHQLQQQQRQKSAGTGSPSVVGASLSVDSPKSVTLSGNMSDTSQAEMAIHRILNSNNDQQGITQPDRAPGDPTATPESVAPVPKLARLLQDANGKFMYVGDSASLSFVQSVRRMVVTAIGDCDFTTDPKRLSIIEPPVQSNLLQPADMLPMNLEIGECRRLTQQYLMATSGWGEVFDVPSYHLSLDAWVADKNRDQDVKSAIFYLVLAIGFQVSSDGDQTLAEKFFLRGRHMAFITFSDAPSLLTIQSYLTITMYMLGASRRNGAYMHFGIAVRAAFALGMHKPSTHALFDEAEATARRKLWHAVRVMDIYLSASLGRPPATSDLSMERDTDIVENAAANKAANTQFTSKVLDLCDIFERIIIDVYMKKAVSTRLADSISSRYREWTSNLPESLQFATLDALDNDPDQLLKVVIASHTIAAYHWSIILLTRPFLTYQVIKDMSKQSVKTSNAIESSSIKTYADACVDSALRCLNIAQALLRYPSLPHRLPHIVNSVCNASLVLGAATFADQDKFVPLEDGLQQGISILNHFARWDAVAARYAQVLTYLQEATKIYIHRRSQSSMESRATMSTRLFGQLGQKMGLEPRQMSTPGTVTSGITPGSDMAVGLNGLPEDQTTQLQNQQLHQSQQQNLQLSLDPNLYPRLAQTTMPPPAEYMPFAADAQQVGVLPGLIEGGFFPNFQGPNAGIIPDQAAYPDDAYFFLGQDMSMFGFC